jgi:hypothetical protein
MVYSDVCRADTWHKYGGNYRNRPNQCYSPTGKDGWYWTLCCGGQSDQWKCHDGCKLISGEIVGDTLTFDVLVPDPCSARCEDQVQTVVGQYALGPWHRVTNPAPIR